MDEEQMMFPEALRNARKAKKLTQTELADAIGVSFMTVRRYETGKAFPDMATLGKIYAVLKEYYLTVAWLNSFSESNGLKSLSDESFDFIKTQMTRHVVDASKHKFLEDLIATGSNELLLRLSSVARCFLRMNGEGVDRAIEQIKLLSKIPDYQDSDYWTRDEGDNDGKEKTNP